MVTAEVQPLLESIAKTLKGRAQNFSLAESCTGGLASAYVTTQPGSSDYYMGGVVSYSNSVKAEILGVPTNQLQCVGAVSLPVAKSMAQGVRENLKTHWGLSVTGIAGPGGGSENRPVGTVCFSWVGPGFEKTELQEFKSTLTRQEIQEASAIHCLKEFQRHLKELGSELNKFLIEEK